LEYEDRQVCWALVETKDQEDHREIEEIRAEAARPDQGATLGSLEIRACQEIRDRKEL